MKTPSAGRCLTTRSLQSVSLLFLSGLVALLIFAIGVTLASAEAEPDPTSSRNPAKQLTLEQLSNIEVTTVSKEPEQVWKTAAAIYVITHDQIEHSGVTTIPDALRLAPGVEVAQVDSHQWSVGIRGFGSNLTRNVLVLIDGRTVYTTLLAGTYWEVQNVMLEDVDRIEVIRGPGGTIWGPNAVNGVINIITRSSKDTRGEYVSAGGGSVDQGFFNARYGAGNGDSFDYRVYALGFVRGPQYHSDANRFDAWRAAQIGFRTDWAQNSRDSFTVQGDLYDEGAGYLANGSTYNPPANLLLRAIAPLSGGNLLARWQRTQGEGKDFQLQVFYDRTNRSQPNFVDIRNTYDIDFIDRFRWSFHQQILWGLGARASHGDNPVIFPSLTFTPRKRTDELYRAFLEDDIGLVPDRLVLSLGTKLLKTNLTDFQWQPSARLLWTPTSKQTLWAAYTRAVRTPSDAERNFSLASFLGPGPGGIPFFARFNPNPRFKSEELNGFELGYRQLLVRKVYVDIASFYNHYGNLFSEDITGPIFLETNPAPTHLLLPADFGNGLRGTTEGVEIAPQWQPVSYWTLRGTYSFLEMHIKKEPVSLDFGSAPIVQGSSPHHRVTVESNLDFAKQFNFNLEYRYVSSLPALHVNAYSTADARLAWQVHQLFQLSVVGQNLFQPHHVEFSGVDPGPPIGIKRSVYGQITWTR